MAADADTVVWQLEQLQSDSELAKVRKRLGPGEAAIGIRMGDLFATAKAHTDLDLVGVDRLLDHPAYEPRMAAMCILDFKARRRLDEAGRSELADIYLRRHDRITTWDMVDRQPRGARRSPRRAFDGSAVRPRGFASAPAPPFCGHRTAVLRHHE